MVALDVLARDRRDERRVLGQSGERAAAQLGDRVGDGRPVAELQRQRSGPRVLAQAGEESHGNVHALMLTAAILTISDTRSAGTREDTTTALMVELLEQIGIEIGATRLVPDEQDEIAAAIVELCEGADLVLTSGGTGLAPRDVTPEATRSVIDREAPGIAEAMRAETAQFQRLAWLSRAVAGTRGRTLIINLPGNPKAVRECLGVLEPMLPHALKLSSGADAH